MQRINEGFWLLEEADLPVGSVDIIRMPITTSSNLPIPSSEQCDQMLE